MQNGSSSPQLRTFIYGSLLYYIQSSEDYSKEEGAPLRVDLGQGPWMEYSGRASLSNMNLTMLNNYGENLMEMVCKDASSGHDVTKVMGISRCDGHYGDMTNDYEGLDDSHLLYSLIY